MPNSETKDILDRLEDVVSSWPEGPLTTPDKAVEVCATPLPEVTYKPGETLTMVRGVTVIYNSYNAYRAVKNVLASRPIDEGWVEPKILSEN